VKGSGFELLAFIKIDAILVPEERGMKKFCFLAIVLLLLSSGSAWAQLSLGGMSSVFAEPGQSVETIVSRFKQGEGIFYGSFIELGLKNIAIGGSLNWLLYSRNMGATTYKMVDYDLGGYIQGHVFSYRAFLDPFLEVGFGKIASDYAEPSEDTDSSNPITASVYFHAGGGLGLNLGNLGFFVKALYAITSDSPVMNTLGFALDPYPLKPLKVFLGAKIIL
jgi:hypothetical protein